MMLKTRSIRETYSVETRGILDQLFDVAIKCEFAERRIKPVH